MDDPFGKSCVALVVDEDEATRQALKALLDQQQFEVRTAGDLETARVLLEPAPDHIGPDLLLVDPELGGGGGLALAEALGTERGDDVAIVLLGNQRGIDSSVVAIRLHLADFVAKPLRSDDEVTRRLRRAMDNLQLRRRNQRLIGELQKTVDDLKDAQGELESRNTLLQTLAIQDRLTGLVHHAQFQEELDREIARSQRYNHNFGLVYFDVDRFKTINDAHGHGMGDEVLKELAQILIDSQGGTDGMFRLRETDVAARYGGDEFVLILPETSKGGAESLGERLRRCVSEHEFGDGRVQTTISVGIASFPEDGTTRDTLLNAADTALYRAKALGRNRIVSYTSTFARQSESGWRESTLERRFNALDRSIVEGAFNFVYQPIIFAEDHRTFGYEALCRPMAPEFSNPEILFRTAEQAGRTWQLGRALRELALNPFRELPGEALMFINLHPREVEDPELLTVGRNLLQYAPRVVFEITERAAIHDYSQFENALRELRKQGFRIAIDDLGSGYASLNSLALLEPDFVKIDMMLVRGIRRGSRQERLVRHLVDFALDAQIQVIAEGVETEEELNVVTDLGCSLLQGFFFAAGSPPFVQIEQRRFTQ